MDMKKIQMMKKAIAVAWLLGIAFSAMFVFSYTPIEKNMGLDERAITVQEAKFATPGVTDLTNQLEGVAPKLVVKNQKEIDVARSTAKYLQISVAFILLVGSALLILARKYEKRFASVLGAIVIGAGALFMAIGMILMDKVPSESLPTAFGLLAIMAAVAGPVLQLMAPDRNALSQLAKALSDGKDLAKELKKVNGQAVDLGEQLQGQTTRADKAEAEIVEAEEKVAQAEAVAEHANARADAAEKRSDEAEIARRTAETLQATAESKVDSFAARTEHAEEHAAGLQVRLNAFEERRTADHASADLAVAEITLATAEQHTSALQDDLQSAEADLAHLQSAHSTATNNADAVWRAVEDTANGVLTAEGMLERCRKASEAGAEAVAKGVEVSNLDVLEQQLSDAEMRHTEASDTLTRLRSEAREADVAVGSLAADLKHAEGKVADLTAKLVSAQSNLQTAKDAFGEAAKVAESAEVEAVAAKHRFAALTAAEQKGFELATELATERSEKAALVADVEEQRRLAQQAGRIVSLQKVKETDTEVLCVARILTIQDINLFVGIHASGGADNAFCRPIPAGKEESEIIPVPKGHDITLEIQDISEFDITDSARTRLGMPADIPTYKVDAVSAILNVA